MQVSIVNYERGEDKLGYEIVSPLQYNWDNSKGTLEISGVGTDEQYRDAISKSVLLQSEWDQKCWYQNICNWIT